MFLNFDKFSAHFFANLIEESSNTNSLLLCLKSSFVRGHDS